MIDRQLKTSLVTCAVVVAATLGFWLLGKLSWNRDPLVSQLFQAASLETLTNRPHSAGLELHHALASGNFTYAKNLVGPDALGVVERAQTSCGNTCPSPERSRGKVFTRATLQESSGRTAVVHAESFDDQDTLLNQATYDLTRTDDRWLVVGVRSD